MSLEKQIQKKKIIIKKYPSLEVLAQAEKGNKFIIVEDDFDFDYIPQGYTLIDMKHKGNSFKTLIPQSLLFYMANPGEGDAEGALEEIADFYGEAEDFEDDMIENGETNIQEANWATLSRNSYETYLVNRLVKRKKGERDEEGEPVPEFNQEVLNKLDLDDDYVTQRVKAIAALSLGKTADQVNAHEIRDVLKHVTVREQGTKELTREEFNKITCWAGSHYAIKEEYQNRSDVEYNIDSRHSTSHKVGTKTTKQKTYAVLDSKIGELETDITEYRKEKNKELGRHDQSLIRQYVNLSYIAPENPQAQLDIKPPEKQENKNG